MKHTARREVYFWGLFFALNFLLFLPTYVANMDHTSFFPWSSFGQSSPVLIGKDLFYNRTNLDFFRWSIEFSFLLFLPVFLFSRKTKRKSLFLGLIFLFYLLLLIYQIYHQSFYAIYQTPPFFYNDLGLLKVGWSIFWNDFNGKSIAFILLLLGLLFIIFRGLRLLVNLVFDHSFSRFSKGFMVLLFLESLVILFRWGYQAWPEHVLQFQVAPILQNIEESLEAKREMEALNVSAIAAHRPYDSLVLKETPNFFFLFIESYGRIVYDQEEVHAAYQRKVKELETVLAQENWQSRSILSTAPVSGGASWISYSTFLDGFDFKNRGTYWALLKDTLFQQYQHFPRLMQSKGYRNYRLSAIGGSGDMEIPWDDYTRFYAVDEWIKYEDFNYHGLLYGWGPSPPDQFSLNFANQHIRAKQSTDPFTLFFITQNSHNPFLCPDTIATDWQQLNQNTIDANQDSRIFEKPVLNNYIKSIDYQLDFIIDFIVKEGQANDVFIIAGDHQPPLFPKPGAGFETPLHIISKDSSFIHSFSEQDFSSGLYLSNTNPTIQHEGFYSLLMHHLQVAYGDSTQSRPVYLPEGLDWNDWE